MTLLENQPIYSLKYFNVRLFKKISDKNSTFLNINMPDKTAFITE